MFEPITRADLDKLFELYTDWLQLLSDSPETIAVCDAMDTCIEANKDEGQASRVEQAYLDLVTTVQEEGSSGPAPSAE